MNHIKRECDDLKNNVLLGIHWIPFSKGGEGILWRELFYHREENFISHGSEFMILPIDGT